MQAQTQARRSLIVHSTEPFNAEPPLMRLCAALVTRDSDFYVRSHGAIPRLDAAAHRVRVSGRVAAPLDLSIATLRTRFARRRVTAVLQCAGNRRAEMAAVRPVSGDPWAPGAIGNAEWAGVPLADVLRAAGTDEDSALHVAFSAADEVQPEGERPLRYGVSIPMRKALAGDTLLAFEMNGEPLTPEHGFPLRAIVPGYAGVRSAKWLREITVQDEDADNPIQRREYKLLPPRMTAETVDWASGVTINEMPLNAAICDPAPNTVSPAGPTLVRGYAIATGRDVARVDVSCDGGATWTQAALEHDASASWSWTLWRATIDLTPGTHELVVRAWDSAGQTQPSQVSDVWNFKGYLCAAWHRVSVTAR